MMAATEFEHQWTRRFPDTEPVGYEMRRAGAAHWLRFHSLPLSKRYPETDAEWLELLTRQNELANAVLGESRDCWLVQSRWEESPEGIADFAFGDGNDPFRAITEYSLEPAVVTLREQGTEFEQRWEASVVSTSWSSAKFDWLLREIAEEKAAPTLWFSDETGAVFAPYDGGVDLFLKDKREVEYLAREHSDWLTDHPLGL